MLWSPWSRALAVVVLLAGVVGLGVWYGSLAPAPSMGAYPGADELGPDYDSYVGDRVEVAGWAVETEPVVVTVGYPGGTLRLTVTGLDRDVDVGDMVWVYGVAHPDHRVQAKGTVVISPEEFRYGAGASVLAGLWVFCRILRDWHLDRDVWGLAPDGTESGRAPGGGDGDA